MVIARASRTKQQREAAGDPRPLLAERYGTREAHVAAVEAAAAALVTERLLLPTAAAYVAEAQACDRCRATAPTPAFAVSVPAFKS
jgi:hypothetical protein